MKRALKIVGAILLVLVIGIVALAIALRHPLPASTPGPDGDALAKRVSAWVNKDAWDKIGAVKWTTAGYRHYLWDKGRGFVRVRWRGNEVLYDLVKHDGRAFDDGRELDGEAKKKSIEK